METTELIAHANRIKKHATEKPCHFALTEALEFFRVYIGEKSEFYKQLVKIDVSSYSLIASRVISILDAFIQFTENGLLEGISIERKAQIDVVSDFLGQANTLLNTPRVHPAAPAVIIGAALEEFLRNWVEADNIELGGKKASLDSYAKTLREADLITKQDIKDIESWAGLRNHAAHGEWDEVSDKSRIALMLEGVNFFMRKYSKQ